MAKKTRPPEPDRLDRLEKRLLQLEETLSHLSIMPDSAGMRLLSALLVQHLSCPSLTSQAAFLKDKRKEMRETPVPPWKYLVRRQHPWRQQLYITGRKMTARQLVGGIKANQLDEEKAAANYELPLEAIREALAYVEANKELLEAEAEIEWLMLKRGELPVALRLCHDCLNSLLLADLLRKGGHTVVRPVDVGLDGEDDDQHFTFAAAHGLAILTKDSGDFQMLHLANPAHHGILVVYQDNDVTRDMSDAEIVRAIANLEAAAQSGGDPISGNFHILNNWRY